MSKTIGVFFDDPREDGYPLDKEYYRTAYAELAETIASKGGELVVVRGQESYRGNNRFSHFWDLRDHTMKRHDEEIEVDLMYDKGHFVHDPHARLLNDPEMDEICVNKWKTYEMFTEHCPFTAIIQSQKELHDALEAIQTELVVAKPLDGEEGHGVFIEPASAITAKIQTFPYLLQEFIDTSGGIPGIVEGTHDLRIICIGSEIVLCFVRTPPPGKLLANVAQGGRKIEIQIQDIPKEALLLHSEVESVFSRFKRRVYSIDCGRSKDGTWKIIELNSKPGATCRSEGKTNVHFQESLADILLS